MIAALNRQCSAAMVSTTAATWASLSMGSENCVTLTAAHLSLASDDFEHDTVCRYRLGTKPFVKRNDFTSVTLKPTAAHETELSRSVVLSTRLTPTEQISSKQRPLGPSSSSTPTSQLSFLTSMALKSG